jgi:hypothetical protein
MSYVRTPILASIEASMRWIDNHDIGKTRVQFKNSENDPAVMAFH